MITSQQTHRSTKRIADLGAENLRDTVGELKTRTADVVDFAVAHDQHGAVSIEGCRAVADDAVVARMNVALGQFVIMAVAKEVESSPAVRRAVVG